jgi:hypothetical protein
MINCLWSKWDQTFIRDNWNFDSSEFDSTGVKLYIFIHNEVRNFDKNSTQPEIRDNESQLLIAHNIKVLWQCSWCRFTRSKNFVKENRYQVFDGKLCLFMIIRRKHWYPAHVLTGKFDLTNVNNMAFYISGPKLLFETTEISTQAYINDYEKYTKEAFYLLNYLSEINFD